MGFVNSSSESVSSSSAKRLRHHEINLKRLFSPSGLVHCSASILANHVYQYECNSCLAVAYFGGCIYLALHFSQYFFILIVLNHALENIF